MVDALPKEEAPPEDKVEFSRTGYVFRFWKHQADGSVSHIQDKTYVSGEATLFLTEEHGDYSITVVNTGMEQVARFVYPTADAHTTLIADFFPDGMVPMRTPPYPQGSLFATKMEDITNA